MNRRFPTIEALERRTLFAGLTIEATGRLGPDDTFMKGMADDITAKLGGPAQVPQYILSVNADPVSGDLIPTIAHVDGTGTPQTSSSGEIIVLIDYYNISANPVYPSTYIGSTIANFLMNTPVDGIKLASLPIHEVALSRGAGILDGIARALGQSGVWVDQETYLDPDTIAAQGDPPPTIYDNVAFVDDYWRQDGIASNEGQPVNGAYNLNIPWIDGNDAGWGSAHEATTGYYIGTIDQTATQSGLGPIYSDWYGNTPTMPARDQTGFLYTDLVGAARPLSGVWAASGGTGARTAAGQVGAQWGNLTDLTVASGNPATSNNSIQVSYVHEDRDSADTVTYFLDTDRNPYNNNFAANLGSSSLDQAATPTSGTGTISLGNVAPGSYWLCAQVTDATGNVRYAYTSVTAPLTVQRSGSITGTVFTDTNDNGILDAGESGLAGQVVYVDLDGSGKYQPGDPSATTDAQGNYIINGVVPGIPSAVREVVPAGTRETTAPTLPVTLAPGETATVADFATTDSALITGRVLVQLSGASPATASADGFQIILAEHLLGGKTIKHLTSVGADGTFAFAGLQPNARDTVQIVKRKGFKLAPHSRGIYTVKVAAGQIISGLTFLQAPIVSSAPRAKATAK